jgi:hypothetical protein
MCGVCGLLGGEEDWSGGVQRQQGGVLNTRRADRAERIRVLNQVLRPCRVQVSDFHGQSFLVCGATGKQQIADSIAHVWRCVQEMTGTGIDPLVLPVSPHSAGQVQP